MSIWDRLKNRSQCNISCTASARRIHSVGKSGLLQIIDHNFLWISLWIWFKMSGKSKNQNSLNYPCFPWCKMAIFSNFTWAYPLSPPMNTEDTSGSISLGVCECSKDWRFIAVILEFLCGLVCECWIGDIVIWFVVWGKKDDGIYDLEP